MTTLNTKIFNHDAETDVAHKINSIELNNWIDHLRYIQKEMANLISICSKTVKTKLDDDSLTQKLKEKELENDTLLNAFQEYLHSRKRIMECEDTECDMIFITEHESFRKSYVSYLETYRQLKDEFFKKIHDQNTH